MADFYIVPPRLTVGTFDRANVVNSINTLKGDLTFVADPNSGVRVLITGDVFQFSIANDFYVKKSGDTYTKNLVFRPDAGYFGLGVGYGSANPGSGNTTGALFYNTSSNLLQVFDGSVWNSVTGGVGLTETSANLLYLRLDGANTPTGNISMGSQFLRLANLTTQVIAGSTGQIFFNTSTNKINVYDGTAWVTVGLGITAITAGNGITSTFNPITSYSDISVDSAANFTWTGSHTFNNPVTFAAAGQSFSISKLFISGQTSGDIIYFNGTNWTRLGIGNPSQTLQVTSGGTGITWGASSGSATTAENVNVVASTGNSNHPIIFTPFIGSASGVALSSNSTLSFNASTNILNSSGISVTASTASTNSSTGALIVSGGVGIGGSLFVAGDLSLAKITSGAWAGSTITSLYGGTGYTVFAKGDLLGGTGSSLLVLPVGTNNYVLTANSSSATGLTWTPSTSIGTTVVGTPTDGAINDGFFTSWTSSTTIADAMDDISELLALIAPARPNYLTGTSLSATSVPTYYTVKISAGLGNEWYQAGYGTGSSITRYYLSGAHTLTTANTSTTFSAGSLTTSTYGTIYFKRINSQTPTGGGVGTIDLTVNYAVNYTNNNLKLTALDVYNSIWTKANAQINTYTQPNSGYEGVYISHTENNQVTNTYEMWKDAWSSANPNPTFSQSATASTYSQTLKYLSGIGYFNTGTGFSVYFKGAAGIYSSCYNSTQVYAISATGLVTTTGTATNPLYTDELDKSGSNHVRVSLNSSSASSFNKYITATIYKAHNTTASSNATIGRAINTYGTVSTDTYDGFQDEARRLVIGTGIAFTSTIDMANGNLQVRSGSLTYPVAADYDTEWGGTHTFTGDQEYQRYFYKTSASTGTLTFTGFTASNIAAYGTGSVNVLLYLEGDNKYFDLGVLQGSNANDGSSRAAAISAKTSASSGALNWSLGTYTTGVSGAGNSGRYRAIIIFRNNTYTMTSITSS